MKERLIKTMKNNILKISTFIFGIVFLVSLFASIKVLAKTIPFIIESANITDKSSTVSGDITNYNNDEIKNNITFHKVNDYAIYDLVVKNNLSKKITILSITDDNDNEYITYSYNKHENEKLESGQTFDLSIKVSYSKEVNNISNRRQENDVIFTINYLEDGEVKGDTIVINPTTKDNIHISFIVLFISSIGLITCLVLGKKKKKFNILIIGLLLCPVIVYAASFTYSITFKTSVELFDKLMVNYNVDGVENEVECNYGEIISLTDPAKDGYTFTGWKDEDGNPFDLTKPVTKDTNIKATFEIINYSINYDLDGGEPLSNNPDSYTIEDTQFTLNNPSKTGYDFTGWSGTDLTGDDNLDVTIDPNAKKDLSYQAHFVAHTYQVKYDKNGTNVNGTMNNQDFTYDIKANLVDNSYSKDGYIFTGWNSKSDLSGIHYDDKAEVNNLTAVNNDIITLYAEWEANSYTISFDSNAPTGNTATGSMTALAMIYDTASNLPINNYQVEGYTFKNWNTASDGMGTPINNEAEVSNLTTINNDVVTLYAIWEANSYTINFDSNAPTGNTATGTMSALDMVYDTPNNLPINNYQVEGYTFKNWNTASDGTGDSYNDEAEINNLVASGTVTLYAIWEANSYTIIFDSNAPTGATATGTMSALAMVYDTPHNLTLYDYQVEGYTFKNWNTASDGTGTPYSDGALVNNLATSGTITLYAQYDLITYTVTFDVNGGNEENTVIFVNYGDSLGTLPVVTKGELVFDGWYTADNNKIDENYVPTADITFYAKYMPLLCRKATTLHIDTCGTGGSCINAGHAEGDTLVFGSIAYNTITGGSAFDCDVNGDGTYDPVSERFYYVRTLDNDNAVMVSYINFEGADGQRAVNYFDYPTGLTMLPTYNQWSNVKVTFENEYTDIDDTVYAARFLTYDDLRVLTGKTNLSSSKSLDKYPFLLENTRYISSTTSRSGMWLMAEYTDNAYMYYRIHTGPVNRNVNTVQATSNNVARPTIEVPMKYIESKQLDVIKSTITYITNNSTTIAPQEIERYTAIGTLPVLTKDGYTLNGWYFDSNYAKQVKTTDIIYEDTTIYASWNPNPYTIIFNSNAPTGTTATGEMSALAMVYDTASNLPLNDYQVEGYTFIGWNTKANGTGDSFNDGAEVNNLVKSGSITLYAEWEANPYTIIFNSNSPTGHTATGTMSALAMVYDTASNLPTNNYQVEGYTFTGWNTAADGTGDSYADGVEVNNLVTSGSITLYAQYSLITYTVTFDVNGGNEENTVIVVNYGDSVGTLPVATKDGAIFDGWYTADNQKIDENYVPTDDIILYAKYNPLLCRKATSLHTAICSSDGSCKNAGYPEGSTLVFGHIAYDDITGGSAFDCDVNGDGTYDPETERFYYLRTLDNKAVLLSHANYDKDTTDATGSHQVNNLNYVYETAITKLPTVEQWSNVMVTFTNEYTTTDTTTYAARFVLYDDLRVLTGQNSLSAVGSIDNYPYLMENTKFVSDASGRDTYWVMAVKNGNTYSYNRVHAGPGARDINGASTSSKNAARPVIEVPIDYVESRHLNIIKSTLTFISNGGTTIAPKKIESYTEIGTLPTPTKNGFAFGGWYYDPNFTLEVKTNDIIYEDKTIYAKWELASAARIDDEYFSSLELAIAAVDQDGLTIHLLEDRTENITIPDGMNVTIDLGGHTLSSIASNPSTITVVGNLHLINGNVVSASTKAAAVNVDPDGVVVIEDVDITMNGARQVLYNKSGTATIKGDCHFIGKASARATIHNLENGTTNILEGTIISEKLYAVYNESGTVNIGTEDHVFDTSAPIIQGKTYGVIANSKFNFYDGIIKGGTSHIGTATTGTNPTVAVDTNESKINEYEDNCTKEKHPEDIDGVTYQTFYCSLDNSKLRIRFNANGGEVATTSKIINDGDPIGELPVPTNGIYTFVGWFTAKTDGTMINENTVPTTSGTYYARWSYSSSDEIVNFNMDNDVMNVYYSSIDTWKTDQDTFQTNMDTNFNNYNCSKCTGPNYQSCPAPVAGTTLCDQPKGYNTGVPNIKVYISDENTKVKGDEVAYVTISDGIIYNMIPGQTYYWEATDDSNVYGFVKAAGTRRTISSNVRNVRDLGGLEVDVDNDGTVDGTIKYGKLFRGPKLSTNNSDVLELKKLGITEELDLRGSSSEAKFDNYVGRSITNYLIYPDTYASNYTTFRKALKDTMQDVVNDENIYFHCAIGTDRTGTMAFFLEGLLGVSHEDKLEDYELSYFYGLLNRHRFHDNLSGSSINPRFTTMANTYNTNQLIYDYFIDGAANETEKAADKQLVKDFRTAMINYNS